jgi:hypothetical protein
VVQIQGPTDDATRPKKSPSRATKESEKRANYMSVGGLGGVNR